jgi:peptide deformylase
MKRNEIRTYGDPILRKTAEQVTEVDAGIKALADQMLTDMYEGNGIGLAAEQIGRTEAICVIDIPSDADLDAQQQPANPNVKMPLVMINPEVVESSEQKMTREEGCLSFPGIYAGILRPERVKVRYLDRDGVAQQAQVQGLLACAMQHEIDHLNGVLLLDRMSQVKKIALSGKLKRLRKKTQQAMRVM